VLNSFQWFVAAVVVVTIAVTLSILLVPHLRVTLRRVLAALVVGIGIDVVAVSSTSDSFAHLSIIYSTFTIAIPVIGAGVLATFRRQGRIVRTLAVLCLLPGALGVYATFVEPRALEAKTVSVQSTACGGLRIGVFSDIQSIEVGDYERNAMKRLNEMHPDFVLMAGDLYSGEDNPMPTHQPEFVALLRSVDAPLYVVNGDHDSGGYLPGIVEEAGARYLSNEWSTFRDGEKTVSVLGVDNQYDSEQAKVALTEFAALPNDRCKIVLSHKPDVIDDVPAGVDLVVAGHTHGGQIRLPGIGPLVTMSDVPRKVAGGGLFDYGEGRQLFVTRGVGREHGNAPAIRFLSRPEVDVLAVR
jgi:uncharacterized protein